MPTGTGERVKAVRRPPRGLLRFVRTYERWLQRVTYKKTATSTTVQYSCDHFRIYPIEHCPDVGESVVCLRCNKMVEIAKTRLDYRTRCLMCSHSRNHGPARLTAERAASRHHKRYPTHHLVMEYAGEVVHHWRPQQPKLFTKALPGRGAETLDLPPF